jgi:hypothetical protein
MANADSATVSLINYNNLTSNAGGVFAGVYDQTMTNLAGWSDYAVVFDEFRVLGFQIEFFPVNRYTKVTTTCYPGVGVVDRDSNGALASIGAAFAYSSARVLSLEDPWTDAKEYRGSSVPALKWKMNSVLDGTYITTAAPTPTVKAAIKFYFQNLSASTTYGIVVQRMLVQFRGKI